MYAKQRALYTHCYSLFLWRTRACLFRENHSKYFTKIIINPQNHIFLLLNDDTHSLSTHFCCLILHTSFSMLNKFALQIILAYNFREINGSNIRTNTLILTMLLHFYTKLSIIPTNFEY